MPPKSDRTPNQQPGADRFWGQFSQSRAGRSGGDTETTSRAESAGNGEGRDDHCLEWCPICRSAELFKATVSPELKQQAESIQHEAMGVFKAFLDAYAEKTAGGHPTGPASTGDEDEPTPPPNRVTDIPLD